MHLILKKISRGARLLVVSAMFVFAADTLVFAQQRSQPPRAPSPPSFNEPTDNHDEFPPFDFPDDPDPVPIDGGLGFLLLAGGGYAAYKLRRRKD